MRSHRLQMNNFAPAVGTRPPFTATQLQELEHQTLIMRYLIAGVPVPPELVVPIRRSFEAFPGRYYHPSLGYCSYYGKRPDLEPGRCRRTDGKKWRCSKDAYPGSKYCERHMHRGRNRSRKPVESQTISLSQTTSSTLSSLSSPGSNPAGSGVRNLQSTTLQSFAGPSNTQSPFLGVASSAQLPTDIGMLGSRYFTGSKPDLDEHRFFSEASGSDRALRVDSSLGNSWCLMSPRASSFSLSKLRDPSILQNSYPQLQSLQDLGQVSIGSLSAEHQQQQSLSVSKFSPTEPVKHETHFLRPFFDEWPKRDTWSDLEEDRSNRTSFSTTQLSISIPMTPSNFNSTSSRSPDDD